MKKVTIEQFLDLKPCYSEEKIRKIAGGKTEWTALDVLNLEQVPSEDRLWAVLREDFVEAPMLHEFACRCAERALSRVKNPDPRSLQAIKAKRAWLRGEISDQELKSAWEAALEAWEAARTAAAAACAACARGAAATACEAARTAAWEASCEAARTAAWEVVLQAWAAARGADWEAARYGELQWQVEELKKMLVEVK